MEYQHHTLIQLVAWYRTSCAYRNRIKPYTNVEVVPFGPETKEALVTEFGDGRDGRIDGIEIESNPKKVGDRA